MTLGNNGLFNKAKEGKEKYANAQDYEETEIAKITNNIDNFVDGNRGNFTETVLFEGTANEANTDYALNQPVTNFKYIYVSCKAVNWNNIVETKLINTSDIIMNETKNFILNVFFDNNMYYSIRFGFKDNQKFAIESLTNGSSWSNPGQAITRIIGIK